MLLVSFQIAKFGMSDRVSLIKVKKANTQTNKCKNPMILKIKQKSHDNKKKVLEYTINLINIQEHSRIIPKFDLLLLTNKNSLNNNLTNGNAIILEFIKLEKL